ncbi:hypothetical protein [uncultured Roseobacter sp.]|uniref:hypothetical protein n=1 Tax=uncultured Roseobacter sp. TaxID=114847 RepID=UPI00263102FB|nr:hypothetical protein [uncultured Roseobacter sp.]
MAALEKLAFIGKRLRLLARLMQPLSARAASRTNLTCSDRANGPHRQKASLSKPASIGRFFAHPTRPGIGVWAVLRIYRDEREDDDGLAVAYSGDLDALAQAGIHRSPIMPKRYATLVILTKDDSVAAYPINVLAI